MPGKSAYRQLDSQYLTLRVTALIRTFQLLLSCRQIQELAPLITTSAFLGSYPKGCASLQSITRQWHALRQVENCPNCGLMNPDGAMRCDCGYDFRSGTMQKASEAKPGEPSMRVLRAIVGLVAFTLPVLVVVVGMHLDRSHIEPGDQTTARLIEIVLWGSMVLAALVPSALIMTSTLSWPRRVGLTVATLCLLVLECGLTFYIALMSGLR